MGRAGLFQSEVLVHNIIALIQGKKNLKTYKPLKWIEGSIKLTLGKVSCPEFYNFASENSRLIEF